MRKRIVPIIIIIIIIVIVILKILNGRTIYNDSFVNGNLPGNLYNEGKFCEIDGLVYFSNPDDNGYLYSMNSDGSEVTKIIDDIPSYINADKHYVYYVRNNASKTSQFSFLHVNENSLCRVNRKTKDLKILDSSPSLYASLSGNYIYYLRYSRGNATQLYKIGIDGTDKECINTTPYYTCSANNEYLYYTGLDEDHNIYQYNTETGQIRTLLDGNYWMPEITDPALYYLDCINNYSLCRLDFTNGNITKVSGDMVENYVIYDDVIYYIRMTYGSEPAAVCKTDISGLNTEVIAVGDYKNLNVTSKYTYFTDYDGSNTYRVETNGSTQVSIFVP